MNWKIHRMLKLLIVITWCSTHINGSHFKGMTMTWKATENPLEIVINTATAWSLSSQVCGESDLNKPSGTSIDLDRCAANGDSCVDMQNPTLYCTSYSSEDAWSLFVGSRTVTLPNEGPFFVKYSSGSWADLIDGGGSWSVGTYIDLNKREDLRRINNPPQTYLHPTLRLLNGCSYTIQIPATDADRDPIRCRWAVGYAECAGVCQKLPATLNQADCTFTFQGTTNGLYVGAFMIEDYSPDDTTFSNPLSAIPLQVIVKIAPSSEPCGTNPTFPADIPPDQSCYKVLVGTTWTQIISVEPISGSSITSIELIPPLGLERSAMTNDGTKWSRTVSYTSTMDNLGKHLLCFYAIDDKGPPSENRCFIIFSTDDFGTPTRVGVERQLDPDGVTTHFSIEFTNYFVRPENSANIYLHRQNLDIIDTVDVTDPSVLFPKTVVDRKLTFSTTEELDPAFDYYISYDAGIVTGVDECGNEIPSLVEPYFKLKADACALGSHGCEQLCVSLAEKYDEDFRCSCFGGYELFGQSSCSDLDECDGDHICDDGITSAGNVSGVCQNTPGSYSCWCPAGYRWLNGLCQDIDECTENPPCTDQCVNNNVDTDNVMYTCSCTESGFELSNDGTTCTDVDECKDADPCISGSSNAPESGLADEQGTCSNTWGSFICLCIFGYTWDGTKCIDIDECNDLPSQPNGGCEFLCSNSNGGFQCGCDTGFVLNSDGRTCFDENLCQLNNPCILGSSNLPESGEADVQASCQNTVGSTLCTCIIGYILDTSGPNMKCIDINECDTNNGGCEQNCGNNFGAYTCTCDTGYQPNADGHTCGDVDECTTNNGGCSGICTNKLGSFVCSCADGYELSNDKTTCDDINECNTDNGGCEYSCDNTPLGTHTCSCQTGYKLNDDARTCRDFDECSVNNGGCSSICSNNPGSYVCACDTGYELDTNQQTCIDINECDTNNGRCSQICANNGGSYQCSCETGYESNEDKHSCRDKDECASGNGGCSDVCSNTPGSFDCSCFVGYQLDESGSSCTDADECGTNNGGCMQNCANDIGSFTCSCLTGYTINSDARTCSDTNECNTSNGGCAQDCSNSPGSYVCSCHEGYQLGADDHACEDANECDENNAFCEHVCRNEGGTYVCSCHSGFKLNIDQHSCSDENECLTNNGGCDDDCTNIVGSHLCTCSAGYKLAGDKLSCLDVDECKTKNGGCEHICTNTEPSFRCTCNQGYKLSANEHSCEDINECLANNGGCDHTCTNTQGSYYCSCNAGFALGGDNHDCIDINECDTNNGGCEQECNNNPGSYKCSCRVGFDLNDDAHSCHDIDECSTDNGECEAVCTNTIGSYLCSCRVGYELENDKHKCSDINECERDNGNCAGICVNRDGYHKCVCHNGKTRTVDGSLVCLDDKSITVDTCFTSGWKEVYSDITHQETQELIAAIERGTAEGINVNIDNIGDTDITVTELYSCSVGVKWVLESEEKMTTEEKAKVARDITVAFATGDVVLQIEGSGGSTAGVKILPQTTYYDTETEEFNTVQVNDSCVYLNEIEYCQNNAQCDYKTDGSGYCVCIAGFYGNDCSMVGNTLSTEEIVGIAIGVFLFIMVFATAIWILICAKKRAREPMNDYPYDNESYGHFYKRNPQRLWKSNNSYQ